MINILRLICHLKLVHLICGAVRLFKFKMHSILTVCQITSQQLIIPFNFFLFLDIPSHYNKVSMISELQCLMDNTN